VQHARNSSCGGVPRSGVGKTSLARRGWRNPERSIVLEKKGGSEPVSGALLQRTRAGGFQTQNILLIPSRARQWKEVRQGRDLFGAVRITPNYLARQGSLFGPRHARRWENTPCTERVYERVGGGSSKPTWWCTWQGAGGCPGGIDREARRASGTNKKHIERSYLESSHSGLPPRFSTVNDGVAPCYRQLGRAIDRVTQRTI